MILLAVAAAWVLLNHHIVSGKLYPRNAAYLDLRAGKIDTGDFDKLTRKLPGSEIRWNIPLFACFNTIFQ